MIILIAAALAAQTAPVADAYAQHQQQGQAAQQQMMEPKQMMADCKKCCEEMKGRNAADTSEHSDHAHQ